MNTSRRWLLKALGALGSTSLLEGSARATLAPGLTLPELARASDHVVLATPLDAQSSWVELGRQKRIVTDVRVRVEETLARATPTGSELIVRVLGGAVGRIAQRVDGQAELIAGERGTLFLTRLDAAVTFVTGMAQGHYPLKQDARRGWLLRPSPNAPVMLRPETSAVVALSDKTLDEARALVRAAAAR